MAKELCRHVFQSPSSRLPQGIAQKGRLSQTGLHFGVLDGTPCKFHEDKQSFKHPHGNRAPPTLEETCT